ncbi:uncharacterized protein LOC135218499 [Macrobrachium nipponense]|uniref:uncharacterized protein LOC135218499 n=1 Tax=Macrobrachium nipponense TaxID=159736 RepID=UPI0030C8C16A
MDIFFSAIFVCASPAISHVRADVNQVLDTTKGFIAHILFTGGSEGPFLRDSTPTKGYLLPEPSEEALEDVTYKLPSRVVVANSSEQDSTGHGKEVYTAESRTINEERSTKLEYSGDIISSTQGTHSGPGADSSPSKPVSAVRASSERIFFSNQSKEYDITGYERL